MTELHAVTFVYLVDGERWNISFIGDKLRISREKRNWFKVLNNFKRAKWGRPYKPCETHCRDLLRQYATKKPAKSKVAKDRIESSKKDNRKTLGIFNP